MQTIFVNDILNYLNTIAPQSMKMEWDNVGLICGSGEQIVHRVLIALDPFEEVVDEAVDMGANLIITHHPVIFRPIYDMTDQTPVGKTLLKLAKNQIAAINAHTNLDIAPEGVNYALSKALGLENIQIITPICTDSDGNQWGLLRMGTIQEQTLENFLKHVKTSLNAPGLRYISSGKSVNKVAVGGGSCGDELLSAIHAGCDTFITSDVKYNQFRDAYDYGINLIDAGHFHTEDPVCSVLLAKLQKAFPHTIFKKSERFHDHMKFFV